MKNVKFIILGIFSVCLCVGFYFYLSNRSAEESNLSKVQQVITKDLDKSYPKTPREVIKFYNRIINCLYNNSYSDEERKKMGNQARMLMDDELLEKNPEDLYFLTLESDVDAFKKDKKTILSTQLSSSNEVEFKVKEGSECAYVYASYFIKGKNYTERAGQTYILRKDEQGRWKILGYYNEEQGESKENDGK